MKQLTTIIGVLVAASLLGGCRQRTTKPVTTTQTTPSTLMAHTISSTL